MESILEIQPTQIFAAGMQILIQGHELVVAEVEFLQELEAGEET